MLKDILIQGIKQNGPIDLYTYIKMCQDHPIYGYYASKDSNAILGRDGDFITAPEISPFFGEIIAFWIITQWERLGKPGILNLIELGPGRGILMQDILKTLEKLNSFIAACVVHFVEINSSFQVFQTEKNSPFAKVCHYTSLDFIAGFKAPIIVIANEFFDALPVQQYVQQDDTWCRVNVGVSDSHELEIIHVPYGEVPKFLEEQPDTIKILDSIYTHIQKFDGAALIIDYGYWDGQGDSVQAIYKHQKVGILDYPGQADLSVHVNFQNMADQCKQNELLYTYQTQRQFLMDFGVQLRLEQVCMHADAPQATLLRKGVQRLIDPAEMGQLFKVLQIWKT